MCDSVYTLDGRDAWSPDSLAAVGIPVDDDLIDDLDLPDARTYCLCSFNARAALQRSGRIFRHSPYGYWDEEEPVQ